MGCTGRETEQNWRRFYLLTLKCVCTVYSPKIMFQFFSLFSKYAAKTGLDWRKILSKGLKKLYLLSLSKGKLRGGGSQ